MTVVAHSTTVARLIDERRHLPADTQRLVLSFTRQPKIRSITLKPRVVKYKDRWFFAKTHPILKDFTNISTLSQISFGDGNKRALYRYSEKWDRLIDAFQHDLIEEELGIVEEQARQISQWYKSL